MGGAHRHDVHAATARAPRLALVSLLAVVGVAALVAMAVMWPDEADQPSHRAYAAEGVLFIDAEVVAVGPACPVITFDPEEDRRSRPEPVEGCNEVTVRPASGPAAGEDVVILAGPEPARAGVAAGDTARVAQIPQPDGGDPVFGWVGIERSFPLGLLAAGFVLVVAVVARVRGLLALAGLGLAAVVVGKFMLPALLAGGSGVGVALVGSTVIMFVVLYLTHGLSIRTSTALAGTLAGIAVTALLGIWAVHATRLSGVSAEEADTLATLVDGVNFQGLLMSAVVIAGLGVLNDVTITQSSAVWELRAAGPHLTRAELFASGMRIGRDHIASTIYTIVFAYAGTGLMVLMLLSVYDRSLFDALTEQAMAEEVARTLVTAIGLVLAVPITTAIAAATVVGPSAAAASSGAGRTEKTRKIIGKAYLNSSQTGQ